MGSRMTALRMGLPGSMGCRSTSWGGASASQRYFCNRNLVIILESIFKIFDGNRDATTIFTLMEFQDSDADQV